MLTAEKTREYLIRVAAALAIVVASAATASAVRVEVGSTSGTVGDVVTVPVSVVDDLTGLGVYAYELTVTWNNNYATFVSAPTAGTMTAPWGSATVNSGAGTVTVVAAGGAALTGSGTLINLRFSLGPSHGTIPLTLQSALFNEGTPPVTSTANGSLSISALPTINVSPDVGEILVGESLQFSTSGGTPPYTYTSSDPAIADFAGGDLLTGLAPGAVAVTSEDDNGVQNTTTGQIQVRALRLTVEPAAGFPGDVIGIVVSITDPVPYDIRSAQFEITYPATRVAATGAWFPGSVASYAGWGGVTHVEAGKISVAMSGADPLDRPGQLIILMFEINPAVVYTSATLTPQAGLFNEAYTPAYQNGTISITLFPTITIYPDTAELVVGDTQQFTVSGTTVPPLTWGVTDPAVGSIDGTGLFTAVGPGTTQVFVEDSIGATDITGVIEVCDFYITAPSDTVFITAPSFLPIQIDRDVTGMGIYGYELILTYDSSKLVVNNVITAGTLSAPWGFPVINSQPGQLIIVHAGSIPLAGTEPLIIVEMQATVALFGSSSAFNITKAYFNEGEPCARVINGILRLPTAAPEIPTARADLGQNYPNPFNPETIIQYELRQPGLARLQVYAASGALVRTLVNREHTAAGSYTVTWNGRTDTGARVASGVYYYRLELDGWSQERKMILIK